MLLLTQRDHRPAALCGGGAQAVIGVTAESLKLTLDAFRLEQSDRMLLDELEKLLPPDSQVRKLRDELRRRIYK